MPTKRRNTRRNTQRNTRRNTRRTRGQRGGASSCGYSNSYAPYKYDNYMRWRGNLGGSGPIGASVPQNPMQRLGNWFEGKSSLFTPSPFDATNQTQAQYLSSSSHNIANKPPAHTPLDQIVVDNTGVGMYGSSFQTTPFGGDPKNVQILSGIPLARAGKRRRTRRTRRVRRARRARR